MAALKIGEVGFGTPWADQIAFLRDKLDLPTEAWDDIQHAAHDRAFIVAGAQKADLLNDLHQSVLDHMAGGGGERSYTNVFQDVVRRNGWTGWTGEGTQAGTAWRAGIIYQTNMATSYAAGRYKQLTAPAMLAALPYWQYHHADGVMHPRPLHVEWDGLTLRHDHPFWATHFAPNCWRCHCWVSAVAAPGKGDKTAPPAGWNEPAEATGLLPGIDKGFAYAPGANVQASFQSFIDEKLITLDAPIGAAMWQTLKPVLAMERQAEWWAALDTWLASPRPIGRTAVVGTLDPETLNWLESKGLDTPASAAIEVREGLVVGAKQERHLRQQDGLLLSEWRALPQMLEAPGNIYRDTASGKLIFVADGIGPIKAAVEFVPGKLRGTACEVATAYRVSDVDVAGMVKGGLWEPVR